MYLDKSSKFDSKPPVGIHPPYVAIGASIGFSRDEGIYPIASNSIFFYYFKSKVELFIPNFLRMFSSI